MLSQRLVSVMYLYSDLLCDICQGLVLLSISRLTSVTRSQLPGGTFILHSAGYLDKIAYAKINLVFHILWQSWNYHW